MEIVIASKVWKSITMDAPDLLRLRVAVGVMHAGVNAGCTCGDVTRVNGPVKVRGWETAGG